GVDAGAQEEVRDHGEGRRHDDQQESGGRHPHRSRPRASRTSPTTRAGTPATTAWAGTSRVTTAPAPTTAPSPTVSPPRMVALLPIEARDRTSVRTTDQSASVWSAPSSVTALGYVSLMNITPWPTKTPSSIVTPSQMNVWLDILQFDPTEAPFWISTQLPIFVPPPTRHPHRFTISA